MRLSGLAALCVALLFDKRGRQRARDANGRTCGTRHCAPRRSSAGVLRKFPLAPRPGTSRRIVMARGPLVAWSAGTPSRLVVECWPELVLVSGCGRPLPRPLHSALPGVRLLVLVRFLPNLLSQCWHLPLEMANSRTRVMLARSARALLDAGNVHAFGQCLVSLRLSSRRIAAMTGPRPEQIEATARARIAEPDAYPCYPTPSPHPEGRVAVAELGQHLPRTRTTRSA